MDLFRQLGELFLEAVPTIVMVLLFYLFLRASFFRPLDGVLAERKARTEGARRAAENSQASAQEKIREYQEALKKARGDIYAEQENSRRTVLEQRATLTRATRSRAAEEVRRAKEKIFADRAAVRAALEGATEPLAAEIARVILERQPPGSPAMSEAR